MQGIRLTPTSYIVLGLLELAGESTPYGLKQVMAGSVGYFWTLQHAQLYTEPARLAKAGYVTEKREETGRRRKLYSITDRGRRALEEWRTEPTRALAELREPALLKLFFGADPEALAATQIPANEAQLAEFEQIRDSLADDVPEGPRQTLEMGMRFQRAMIAFWEELAERRPHRE
jgi:DNA-binding PadR family transcriptional regulator